MLCSQKSEALVNYSVLTDSEQKFAVKYLSYLPTKEEMRCEMERERNLVQQQTETDENAGSANCRFRGSRII